MFKGPMTSRFHRLARLWLLLLRQPAAGKLQMPIVVSAFLHRFGIPDVPSACTGKGFSARSGAPAPTLTVRNAAPG